MGQHARERPDDRAVVEVGEGGAVREWSFRELDERPIAGRRCCSGWASKPGEPVAYQLPNVLEFVAISLGTLRIGAVCEPLMPIFRERELEFMLRASDSARADRARVSSAATTTRRWPLDLRNTRAVARARHGPR